MRSLLPVGGHSRALTIDYLVLAAESATTESVAATVSIAMLA